jgi:hypothetical protein
VQQHSRRNPVFTVLPFIGYGRLLGGSCFLCKEIGIRIAPKRVEVHMSKTLKLGLQQVDPALSLFLHSTTRFTSAEAKHSVYPKNAEQRENDRTLISPDLIEGCRR